MKDKTRIYVVRNGQETHLVRAPTWLTALGFVAKKTLSASRATQQELVDLVGQGIKVEDALEAT